MMGGHQHAVNHGAVRIHTRPAWAALIHEPQDRAAASVALMWHVGGRLIELYYTPGAE